MANTKIPAELSSTPSISDSGDATAITINSSEDVFVGSGTSNGISGGTAGLQVSGAGFKGTISASRHDNNQYGSSLMLGKSRNTTVGSNTIVQDDDIIGAVTFFADDGTNLDSRVANISAEVDGTPGENDTPGRLVFETTADGSAAPSQRMVIDSSGDVSISAGKLTTSGANGADNQGINITDTGYSKTHKIYADNSLHIQADSGQQILFKPNATEAARFNASGNLGIGTTSPSGPFHVKSATNKTIIADSTFSTGSFTSLSFQRNGTDKWRIFQLADDSYLGFYNDATTSTQMSLHSNDNILFNRTNASFNNDGTVFGASGGSYMYIERTTSGNAVIYVHRRSTDGDLIQFYQGNSFEGSISVSGANINYGGFTGTHDSSGTGISSSTQVGTVLSTIDEEHKPDHAKVKVSNTEGDTRVYGVLQEYKAEETSDTGITSPEHAVVASVGVGSVLVTGSCNGGDLLESNGDGTAKVQDDDIIRSKTIGKVTIGNSETDVKLVSCVLYCG